MKNLYYAITAHWVFGDSLCQTYEAPDMADAITRFWAWAYEGEPVAEVPPVNEGDELIIDSIIESESPARIAMGPCD